jgi:hypothetical protein
MIHLLVKSDGIYLITEMPDNKLTLPQPEWYHDHLDYSIACAVYSEYQQLVQSSKDSAIWVQDQELAEKLIYGQHGMIDNRPVNYYQWKEEYFKKDVIYPVSGWGFEIDEKDCELDPCWMLTKCTAPHNCKSRKVALLIEETQNHPEKPEANTSNKKYAVSERFIQEAKDYFEGSAFHYTYNREEAEEIYASALQRGFDIALKPETSSGEKPDFEKELLKEAISVLRKVNDAIQSSNMKETILHAEIRTILKKHKANEKANT